MGCIACTGTIARRCRILVLVCDECLKLLRAPPQLSYKTEEDENSGKDSNNSSSGSHSLGDMKNSSSKESKGVGIVLTPPRSEEHSHAEVEISAPEAVGDGGCSRSRGKHEAATVEGVPMVQQAPPHLLHGCVLMCSACERGSYS